MCDDQADFLLLGDCSRFRIEQEVGFTVGDGAEVLHGAGFEVGNGDQIEFFERIVNAEVIVVIVQNVFGDAKRIRSEGDLVGRGAYANIDVILASAGALKVTHKKRDEISRHFRSRVKHKGVLVRAGARSVSRDWGV